ncbi:MAG: orotate phosphoribosyltransferase [Elusimicrobiota bacterium]
MNTLKLVKEKKALLIGHFLLSSGLHSDKYIQCAKVLQYPNIAEQLAKALIKKILSTYQLINLSTVSCVISPAIGGIVIGQEVARQLNCRAIFCERENGVMKLRRGFEIKKGENCLVVEDVITTGGSTNEVMEVVKKAGGKIAGMATIIDRSQLKNFAISLLKLKIKTYKPETCPLCKKGIPLVKPGSKSV